MIEEMKKKTTTIKQNKQTKKTQKHRIDFRF